jgi:hypothetical protein
MRKSFFPQILGSFLIASALLIIFSYTNTQKEAFIPTNIPYPYTEEYTGPSMEDMLSLQASLKLHEMSTMTGNNLSNVRNIGPKNMGGRIIELSMDPTNPDDIIIGTHTGGLWRTKDGGLTSEPIDDKAPFLAISSIARNPLNPSTIYYTTKFVGGGPQNQVPGRGVFKSTDNGATFSPLAATQNSDFADSYKVAVSPLDSNLVFVGTGESLRAVLWQSTDGGQSFTEAYATPQPDLWDDIVLLDDGSMMVSSRRSLFYSPSSTIPTFSSYDSQSGITGIILGNRKEIRICRDFPNIIYLASGAFNNINDVYRSEDYGQSWTKLTDPSTTAFLSTGGTNRLLLEVKPDDPDYVLVGGVEAVYSTNGGQSWTKLPNSHIDYHTAVFKGDDFWVGNDGGFWKYNVNSPQDFVNLNENLVNTQFYAGDIFPTGDGYIGGTQDNGTYRYLDEGNGQTSTDTITWGDGGFVHISRQDPNVAYYEDLGRYWRTDSAMSPGAPANPSTNYTQIGEQLPGLSSFPTLSAIANPFIIGYNNHDHVYIMQQSSGTGPNRVIRSVDGGQTFTPLTLSYSRWHTAIACSREQSPTLYYGVDRIWRVDNADVASEGQEVDITPNLGGSFPPGNVRCITPHPSDSNVIYVVFNTTGEFGVDNAWRVDDVKSANPVWTSIQGDLPLPTPFRWIEASPIDPDNHLFLSTDFGLYTTIDGGLSWQRESRFPNVPVMQTRVRESDNKIFMFTHGRGVWKADIRIWQTSIERLEQVFSFKLYPNPAAEEISLEGIDQPVFYRIINMEGKNVLTGTYLPGSSIRISELASGSYSLILESKTQRGGRVFVKE